MNCTECVRARQLVVHEKYEEDCVGCAVRMLAYMTKERRQMWLDDLEHKAGRIARDEVTKMLREECARIAALKEAHPKERT
jgi:hypothetical protein